MRWPAWSCIPHCEGEIVDVSFGEEQTIETPDNRRWKLDKMRISIMERVREWVARKIGDPFATADRYVAKLPADATLKLIREAEDLRDELATFMPGSRLW